VGTIKFVAHVGTMPIKVLIDGGSLDNFLQPKVAHFLNIPVETGPSFKVMVGNSGRNDSTTTSERTRSCFTLSVFLLPISSADLILGARWLNTIGPHLADYDSL